MNFPACRTCVFLDQEHGKWACNYLESTNPKVELNYNLFNILDPDQFFCSEHETKDGERFVNWGKE